MKRLVAVLPGVLLLFAARVAYPQNPGRAPVKNLQFSPPVKPDELRAVDGRYPVRWDDWQVIDDGLCSLTWYYATLRDGSDRKRMTTWFRDDFSDGFRANWKTQGQFGFEWIVRKEGDRHVFVGPANGGPATSKRPMGDGTVVSVLARAGRPGRSEFGFGIRREASSLFYALRVGVAQARLVCPDEELCSELMSPPGPRDWCWYEMSIRRVGRRSKDFEIRVRIWDEQRRRVLLNLPPQYHRPKESRDLDPQKRWTIELYGPGEFAEVYVDPWAARWMDHGTNEFDWNTAQVPDGSYYLVSEVTAGNRRPALVVSDFQVEVRNRSGVGD